MDTVVTIVTWSAGFAVLAQFDAGRTRAAVERRRGREQTQVRTSSVTITAGRVD